MKKFFARRITLRKTAFTLVELLVVIGIIAILAAVTMQIAGTVIAMAKRTKAQNTATQIQTAALGYYTEYSVYPTPSGAAAADFKLDDTDSAGQWGPLIECLSGMISPTTSTVSTAGGIFSNSRQIAFLSLKASDVDNTSGHQDAPLNPLPPASGAKYFNIAIDGDYDGILGVAPSTVTTMPNFTTFSATGGGTSTAGIAVWASCNYRPNMTNAAWYVHTY